MNHDGQSTPIRILLVEDSTHDQIAFKRALERSSLHFEVTACDKAEDIPSAMQAGSDAFDIVVVDQKLPGLTGLASYKQMRQNTELPPFIMLTGAGSEDLAVDALKAGMYDYIIKDPHQGYLQLLPLKLVDVRQRYLDRVARLKAKAELQRAHAVLEQTVKKRTADLARTVEALEDEIDERTKTEEALRKSEQQLRYLSMKIIETQENERRQMAKELHDSIGSALASIKFAVEERLHGMRNGPPEDEVSLETVVNHIRNTIKEVRRISTSLRPAMLDDLGLLPTVEWYCDSCAEIYTDTRIQIDLDINEDDISDVAKIVIYRVLQEALNNALKHSRAETVDVILERDKGCIRMCVRDNGEGFDPEQAMEDPDPLTGYGLRGMYDRAEVVNGLISVDSKSGQGTAVCLELPCELKGR